MDAVQSWASGLREYKPVPQDLSRLNPIQRYFHKGSLEWSDYGRLIAVVLVYWLLRPYIQRTIKRWSSESQGEEEREAYQQRREEAKVSANDIRSGKQRAEGKTLGQILDEGVDGQAAAASGVVRNGEVEVKNRKQQQQKKKKGVSFAMEKSAEEKTLDWEDDSEFDPTQKPLAEGEAIPAEKNDIKEWMEKWTA
ncbi:hypothetical protein H2198_005566 [Neophaeococcomyces mojaviensis]|uniref:Uncharacterized protein n=1 Tax=Neophaeococcomyces mojaviensis TaxID=3383035 RepID=A0ACC3A604_9EURO|nr:hypothetical protein H2198_005566 [Knufia sp. JES_112]